MEVKVSPDEKITLNALDSTDPFSRQGKSSKPLNQHIPKGPKRDFSHYDEPILEWRSILFFVPQHLLLKCWLC